VREHKVTGVPKIVVNRTVEILGPVEEEELEKAAELLGLTVPGEEVNY